MDALAFSYIWVCHGGALPYTFIVTYTQIQVCKTSHKVIAQSHHPLVKVSYQKKHVQNSHETDAWHTPKKHRDFLREILACLFSLLEITPSELPNEFLTWHLELPVVSIIWGKILWISNGFLIWLSVVSITWGGVWWISQWIPYMRYWITVSVPYTWDTKLETFELLEHTSEMSVWMITCNFWSKFM